MAEQDQAPVLTLLGRIFVRGDIRLLTGLHIGAEQQDFSIGGLDKNAVLRDVLTNRPYIPGSSLKGKLRSLSEKFTGAPQNNGIGQGVRIHVAQSLQQYHDYWVNPVFGVPSDTEDRHKFIVPAPTRLVVRDVFMSENSAERLERARTDQPFTEVKTEVAIDRITSRANPRSMERVPADTVFDGMELVYSAYSADDLTLFLWVILAMQLLEDDFLGGQGSRGSGKIRFERLTVSARTNLDYLTEQFYGGGELFYDVPTLQAEMDGLEAWLFDVFQIPAQ